MDPSMISAGVGLFGQVGGSIWGSILASGDRKAADRIIDKALRMYGNMDPATLEEVAAQEVGPSELQNVQVDPGLKDAQMRALSQFDLMREGGGMTLADEAAQNKAMGKAARHEAAGRNAIKNDMAARGTLGSGNELAMRLQNQQASAQRANEVGMDTAAAAQSRYFDSILAQGDMAGKVRGQDYAEKSQAAQAQDAIAKYNADMRMRAQNQRNANRNAQFSQQMQINDRKSDLMQTKAGRKDKSAERKAAMLKGVGSAVNQGAQAYGQYQTGQPSGGAAPPAQDASSYAGPGSPSYTYGGGTNWDEYWKNYGGQ